MWEYKQTELYHYGVPGMKWGHRKILALEKKERKLLKSIPKDEKRYAKALKKYEKAASKNPNSRKTLKLQLKEQAARGQLNKQKMKLDAAQKGRQITTDLMNRYADSPQSLKQLASAALNKGKEKANALFKKKK